MEKKYNSTTNQKYINNPIIYNLKSTSQRINMNNFGKEINYKNNNDINAKSIGDFMPKNNLIDLSQNDNISSNQQNLINDEFSLDNISNIIDNDKKKISYIQMTFEDNKSSPIDNSQHINNNLIQQLTDISDTKNKTFSKNSTKIYDSYTKSFQLKLKKMKEMNNTIIKENTIKKNNKTMNNSKKSENIYKFININNSKSIINCKQKIISMKNKNKLIENMNGKGLDNFNIHLNDVHNNNRYNNNLKKNNENKSNKVNSFLCCYGKC